MDFIKETVRFESVMHFSLTLERLYPTQNDAESGLDPHIQNVSFKAIALFEKPGESEPVEVGYLRGKVVPLFVRGEKQSLDDGMDEDQELCDMWGGLLEADKKGLLGKNTEGGLEYILGIVALERMEISVEYRGLNIGANLIQATIETLNSDSYLVVLHAFPMRKETDPVLSQKAIAAAQKKLIAYYKKIGFSLLDKKSGLMVLDPKFVQPSLPQFSPFEPYKEIDVVDVEKLTITHEFPDISNAPAPKPHAAEAPKPSAQ